MIVDDIAGFPIARHFRIDDTKKAEEALSRLRQIRDRAKLPEGVTSPLAAVARKVLEDTWAAATADLEEMKADSPPLRDLEEVAREARAEWHAAAFRFNAGTHDREEAIRLFHDRVVAEATYNARLNELHRKNRQVKEILSGGSLASFFRQWKQAEECADVLVETFRKASFGPPGEARTRAMLDTLRGKSVDVRALALVVAHLSLPSLPDYERTPYRAELEKVFAKMPSEADCTPEPKKKPIDKQRAAVERGIKDGSIGSTAPTSFDDAVAFARGQR